MNTAFRKLFHNITMKLSFPLKYDKKNLQQMRERYENEIEVIMLYGLHEEEMTCYRKRYEELLLYISEIEKKLNGNTFCL